MIRILANDGIHPTGQGLLEEAGFLVDTNNIPQEELVNKLNEYDAILVRSATQVRKELIDACPNLKLIGRGGVGLDNIDVEYAKSKGIAVVNTPAASSNSVAELVFAHLLSSIRFLNRTNRQMATNEFGRFKELKKETSKGQELFGKTLGIIGFGRIGRETARIAIGMGMNVIANDPFIQEAKVEVKFHPKLQMDSVFVDVPFLDLDDLLAASDFVSLHIPGGGDKPVIGEHEISLMKKGSVLVNCARGGVVDERAMSDALAEGHLKAVGLDVFEQEPPVNMQYFTRDDVSLSPHIGAATSEAQERIGKELAQQIIDFFKAQ